MGLPLLAACSHSFLSFLPFLAWVCILLHTVVYVCLVVAQHTNVLCALLLLGLPSARTRRRQVTSSNWIGQSWSTDRCSEIIPDISIYLAYLLTRTSKLIFLFAFFRLLLACIAPISFLFTLLLFLCIFLFFLLPCAPPLPLYERHQRHLCTKMTGGWNAVNPHHNGNSISQYYSATRKLRF